MIFAIDINIEQYCIAWAAIFAFTMNNTTNTDQTFLANVVSEWMRLYIQPLLFGLGIIGNTLSFLTLRITKLRKSTTCYYMSVLATLDWFVMWFILIFYLERFDFAAIYQGWTCRVVFFAFYIVIFFDVLILVAMTLEKYIAVRFPLKAISWCNMRKARFVTLALGVFCLGLNIPHLIMRDAEWKVSSKTGIRSISCTFSHSDYKFYLSQVWPWIDASIYSFIPLALLFILNILIVVQLRTANVRQKSMISTASVRHPNSGGGSKATRQITKMLLIVSTFFLICTTPVVCVIIIENYAWDPNTDTPQQLADHAVIRTIVVILMYCNHVVNFGLYYSSSKSFRTEFQRLFCSCQFVKAKGPSQDNLSNSNRCPSSDVVANQKISTVNIRNHSNETLATSVSTENVNDKTEMTHIWKCRFLDLLRKMLEKYCSHIQSNDVYLWWAMQTMWIWLKQEVKAKFCVHLACLQVFERIPCWCHNSK